MFLDEVRLSSLLYHKNIVQVFDFGAEKDTHFIVMEHVDGVPIEHVVDDLECHAEMLSEAAGGFHDLRFAMGLAFLALLHNRLLLFNPIGLGTNPLPFRPVSISSFKRLSLPEPRNEGEIS